MYDNKDATHKCITEFLGALRDSSELIYRIFTLGSCHQLYNVLKTIWTDAEPYYSKIDGHTITKIAGNYYDIGGQINPIYVDDKHYKYVPASERKGYNLCKYGGTGVSISKYIEQ